MKQYCVFCQYSNERDMKPLYSGWFCKKHFRMMKSSGWYSSSCRISIIKNRISRRYDLKFRLECQLRDRAGPKSGKKILAKLEALKKRIKKDEDKLFRYEWMQDIINQAKLKRRKGKIIPKKQKIYKPNMLRIH